MNKRKIYYSCLEILKKEAENPIEVRVFINSYYYNITPEKLGELEGIPPDKIKKILKGALQKIAAVLNCKT